jgi:alkylhydroperoxidase/carboxymuconolactone decarboxylase family protein YurZ
MNMSGENAEPSGLMVKILTYSPTYPSRTSLSRQMIAEEDPEFLETFHWLHMHMLHERRDLPGKIKEICICAIDAATGYSRGLYTHFKSAIEKGAAKEELFAGMYAAHIPGGIHILTMALPVLGEIYREMTTCVPSALTVGQDHQLLLSDNDPIMGEFSRFLMSDFRLPEKYEHIIKASVMMVNEKYDLLDEEIGLALHSGASVGEVFEGLCSSSHGWRLRQ